MATFTPPTLQDWPQLLVDSTESQTLLYRHFQRRTRGVNVFKLSDGTYVQDTPTPGIGSSSTSVPYPYDPSYEWGPGVYATSYDPVTSTYDTYANSPYVVTTYYGGHSYTVSSAEASALTTAGYGSCIT